MLSKKDILWKILALSVLTVLAAFGAKNIGAQDNKTMTKDIHVKREYVSVNGLKMYYEIHGTGRPLVLLHGAFGWAATYPVLAKNRQVIAVEMQGHGHTADIDRPLSYEQMADDTAALLKHLKIEQADFFGYSMGGTTALALAIRHPTMVRRLAIFGSNYRKFSESFDPETVKQFDAMTPENFAPKELKRPL